MTKNAVTCRTHGHVFSRVGANGRVNTIRCQRPGCAVPIGKVGRR